MSSTTLTPVSATPARGGSIARASVGLGAATATLARQKIVAAIRSGDAIFAVFGPVVFFVCFYVPLHRQFELGGGDYAQFLTPIILLQAGLFTAITATETAGHDARAGVHERTMSLPIPRVTPFLGRMAWVVVRMLLALAGGVGIGSSLGFRFHGTAWHTVAFLALVVIFGLSLSMLTDAVGTVARNSVSIASILMIPQLILVMASTGLVPAEGFPDWAQPFVRNQPMSVFADALRALASGTGIELTAALSWAAALLTVGGVAIVAAGRAQVSR
ncbi:ABC transporter permease [Nocardia otitidiscaviarum]|uniref:ABC transporter permease n=1 Tax=Nocardia otitidiscaviarum TaxID=1823 RepID=UPI0004A7731E|nr:ABC transporter permease [Nocardia otitidiscaviarum]MBF6133281.1 ABC transporter permease [Nocardia otitidiscaviarum]MBF6486677.1 ABC transporter permease [Nocardia otitidiscaviarum]